MVTNLVGNDVGIREITVGTELFFHRGEERQVDVQLLVARAVEGTHGGRALSAGGLRAVGIEHHGGVLILRTVLLENLRPHILGTCQDLRRELGQRLFFLGKLALTFADLRIGARQRAQSTVFTHLLYDSLQGIASRQPGHQGHYDNTTDTQTGLCATAHTTAVFHIRAFASSV